MAVRIVQVGLGIWGRDWARTVVPHIDGAEAVAWVDGSAEVRGLAQAEMGCPPDRCFERLEDALAAVEADAVLATVPLAHHAAVTRAALEAGCHVLVEKPFTPTADEAVVLADLAEARDRLLMVNQNYRYFPATQAVAALVRGGSLGPVVAVEIDFRHDAEADGYRYYDLPDPLLGDMAIHHFDMLRLVLGVEADSVACQSWSFPGSRFVFDPAAAATMRFGAATVSYRGSWISRSDPTPWGGLWRMDFVDGEVMWTTRGDKTDRLEAESVIVRRRGEAPKAMDLPSPDLFDRLGVLDAFVAAIARGDVSAAATAGLSTGRDNIHSLAIRDAAIRSAADGGAPVCLERPAVPIRAAGQGA